MAKDNTQIGVRVSPEEKQIIEQAAENERRSVSSFVRYIVLSAIERKNHANTEAVPAHVDAG